MAKRRKKKSQKKQPNPLIGVVALFAFFILIFQLFQIGKTLLLPEQDTLPKTITNQRPIALGVDVSEWQGIIDWEAVKADGYSFAIIRSGYGVENMEDAYFKRNVEKAKEAGLKVGAYHYAHATTIDEALVEADFFISLLEDYTWDYPVFYDIETDRQDHLSQSELTEIAKAFLERVEDAGFNAGIYASEYWLEHRLDMEELSSYDIWVASYTDFLSYEGDYDMWQYSMTADVDGIQGDMDVNIAYKRY